MAEWSNDQVLKFLELYASERLLWDASHKDHKKKHKVHDAWKRISENLENTPIEDLKSKKKSLMATFRPLLKKKKASIKSGAGADEVFQPIWFAFDVMESFLGTVYDVEDTINTESEPNETEDVASLIQDTGETENEENKEKNNEENITKTKAYASKKRRTGQAFDAELAQKQVNDSFKTLNQVLQSKQVTSEDDCDLYGKLLATKLKRYPIHQRQRIMYKIDGLLLDNPPETFPSAPSSSSASRPSSAYTPQNSPGYLHNSQAFVYSHHQPSPAYSHDSQASSYSQNSQPSPVDSYHYQRTTAYATTSQLPPFHVQVQPLPLQNTPRTKPYSSVSSPAQVSQPSPLHIQVLQPNPYSPNTSTQSSQPSAIHLEPNPDPQDPLSSTSSIIQNAFVDALTENNFSGSKDFS